ncbi:MAG: alpha/beta hydrolase [Pseudomonadota bacterium]
MRNVEAAQNLRKRGSVGEMQVDDLTIAYWLLKGGPNTIVFLHGNSAGKEAFYQQFEGLADTGYTLLALDLPGHGSSSNSLTPAADYTFPAFAALTARVLTALNIKRPLIVGWSLGGHVVIEMAGQGTDLAGALICGTPPVGPGHTEDMQTAFIPSPAMAVTLKENPAPQELSIYVAGLYGSLAPLPAAFPALAQRMDGAVRSTIGDHWLSGKEGYDQRTVVAEWDKPLAIIHGDDDVFASKDYIDALASRALWNGGAVRMPGVGHAPFLEAPEVFNRHLQAFASDVFGER